jgi:hypothetical protein
MKKYKINKRKTARNLVKQQQTPLPFLYFATHRKTAREKVAYRPLRKVLYTFHIIKVILRAKISTIVIIIKIDGESTPITFLLRYCRMSQLKSQCA